MFRIENIFENASIALLKIEGKITDSVLDAWSDSLREEIHSRDKQVIIDFCCVSHIGSRAIERLAEIAKEDTLVFNCPLFLKNMLRSNGSAVHVLDCRG